MHSALRLILLTALLAACAPIRQLLGGEAGNIETVPADDPAMNSAIQGARDTLELFIAALQSPTPTQTYFSVKARFPYDGGVSAEHIWLNQVSFDGETFRGILANEGVYIPGLHLGDQAAVSKAQISDWLIVDGGRLLGGYTIHALRSRMTDDERREFDADMGVSMGDEPELP